MVSLKSTLKYLKNLRKKVEYDERLKKKRKLKK